MKNARVLWGESMLWLKTEWRFHFWLGVSAVVVSLYFALSANDPSLFGRLGALMTHDQSLHSFGREYQCNLPTEIASSNICGNS